MPFADIQILKGHLQKRKDEMARRVVDAVSGRAVRAPDQVGEEAT